MLEYFLKIIGVAWAFLTNAAPWILLSFLIAALFHNVVTSQMIQKHLGTKSFWSMLKVTLMGMLLPMCDCGSVPLGISMYYSGAYLGPVLNFVTATPMINPASLILVYGLLGPELAIIYLISGLVIPMAVGLVANALAGNELSVATNPKFKGTVMVRPQERKPWKESLLDGFSWVLNDFGLTVSRYTIVGVLGAAFITVVIPPSFIQTIMGDPSMLSIGAVTLLASMIFVCAIGHIPFVAALLAAGAAPGTALTFLMIGSATNFTENLNLYKMIGVRAMLLNLVQLILYGMTVGYVANKLLMPGFVPILDLDRQSKTVDFANSALIIFPGFVEVVASVVVIGFAIKSVLPSLLNFVEGLSAEKN